MTQKIETLAVENSAETMRKVMEQLGKSEPINNPDSQKVFTEASVVILPDHRKTDDLTDKHRHAAQFLKPARRKGTATLKDLDSLILWANRFKGETSVLFANPEMDRPSLTCIADYHAEGAIDVTTSGGDASARHCHHKAHYGFPLSDEWKDWLKISGVPLDKDELGEFIESNAKNIMNPTAAVLDLSVGNDNRAWENRMIDTALQIEGRYGSLTTLLALSKKFQVYEKSDLTVSTNRDTGESEVQFTNEHKGADGKPINIPNLIIIAIPVFLNGALYRMAVRFRYRKMGGEVKFILSIYNPEKSFEAAFGEALITAKEETLLPLFKGTAES